MTIDIKQLPKYREAVAKLSAEISKGATPEEQEALFAEAFNTLGDELNSKNAEELKKMFDVRAKNENVSAEEIKFFNELAESGTKTELIIPEEVMIRVFDDLKEEHPLLSVLNFKNTGLRLKAIIGATEGEAQWGPIYGDIKGQLNQAFDEIDFGMNKLTAFVVLPKDALKFSYSWLKQFITEQIKEAISVALELAIVKGDGNNQPVGLIKDLSKPSSDGKNVTYPTSKTALADLSAIEPANAVKMLAPIMKHLSTVTKTVRKQDGSNITETVYKAISGKVNLLINPADRWALEAQFTKLTDGGAYVLAIPYGIKLIESRAVDEGQAIAFVADRYDAFMAASSTIEEFDQTFALEDLQLYTNKSYYYGKAQDNNASALLTLKGA